MVSRETISEMAAMIAEQFDPEKVVLFGSYARREATENSDIDLLVVMEADAPRGKRSAPIIRMLAEAYPLPVDVIVRSPQSLAQWQHVPGSFARRIAAEGVVLYDRPKQ